MIWMTIVNEVLQWLLIVTLLLAYKSHDDKIEILYDKTISTFLHEKVKEYIKREDKNE